MSPCEARAGGGHQCKWVTIVQNQKVRKLSPKNVRIGPTIYHAYNLLQDSGT
jgi:hypothetical protein